MKTETVKELVKNIVDEALTDKERSAAVESLTVLLAEAASKLEASTASLLEKTAQIEAKDAEIATLKAAVDGLSDIADKVEMLEASVSAKEEELSKALTDADVVAAELSVVREKLAQIEQAAVLVVRVRELEEAKVLRGGAALEEQKKRIVSMSMDEFASYKADMVALREEFVAAEAAKQVPLAPVLNLESKDSPTIRDKYQDLGKALAEKTVVKRAKPRK